MPARFVSRMSHLKPAENLRTRSMADCMIADLRDCPQFFDTVADRIWRAWWKPHGCPLDTITDRLRENMAPSPIPLALVAHEDGRFLGTASVIESDLPERPQFTPWVAALWIEPEARRHGLGAALVDSATRACFDLGVAKAYLCARPERHGFYQRLGWTRIESDVGAARLGVFIRNAASAMSLADDLSRSPP
jgi:GNAT superfamily N-acetyltransferase